MDDKKLCTDNQPDQEESKIMANQDDDDQSQEPELDDSQDDETKSDSSNSSDDHQTNTIGICPDNCDSKKYDTSTKKLELKRQPIREGEIKLTNRCHLSNSFPTETNKNSSAKSLKYWILAIIIVIFATAVALALPNKFRKLTHFWKSNSLNQERMDKFLNETKSFVPDIGPKILEAIIYDVFSSDENSIILLLIGNTGQEVRLHNISQGLANLIVELKQEDHFPTFQLNQHYTGDMIEQHFDKVFGKDHRSVMVLEHLELLTPIVATTFHQFVDKDQSRIRKSFTIITLEQNLESQKIDSKMTLLDLETLSSKLLQQLWSKEVRQESLDSLINRFAEYSIVLLP
ncbi:uncharacterized protein LOC124499570 [Dermatophagoides farinae]|uniref:uncharacterized protein LOC124499570 n=1 Tax=Dermatophagoides farinae TaxID=6954 RepID=UPI003F5E9E84